MIIYQGPQWPAEMIEAAERAIQLASGVTAEELPEDRLRGEALLWYFTVLGEAAAQLPAAIKERFPGISWQQPTRLRNRIVHGYWSIDMEILHTTAATQLPMFARDLHAVLEAVIAEGADSLADAQGASPAEVAGAQAPAPAAPTRDTLAPGS